LVQKLKIEMLACGLLEDSGRALFLIRKDKKGAERFELPYILVMPGEDPVSAVVAAFREKAGIDAQAHEIAFEGKHNAGSRKKKTWTPAMAFRMTAKNARAVPSKEFSGFRWVPLGEVANLRLAREAEWLRAVS
jgi:8-oxo-dGTP pyrophosphatase MutT (NUDIX family)